MMEAFIGFYYYKEVAFCKAQGVVSTFVALYDTRMGFMCIDLNE